MALEKIPHNGKYPNGFERMFKDGVINKPVSKVPHLVWADGVDILYTFNNMTPTKFKEYEEDLLLLTLQECERYAEATFTDINKLEFFAGFDVELGKLAKTKDLKDIHTFQTAMHPNPNFMVYGPGYEVKTNKPLSDKIKEILDILERYKGKLNKQRPFKVIHLKISIRDVFRKLEPRPWLKEFRRLNPQIYNEDGTEKK